MLVWKPCIAQARCLYYSSGVLALALFVHCSPIFFSFSSFRLQVIALAQSEKVPEDEIREPVAAVGNSTSGLPHSDRRTNSIVALVNSSRWYSASKSFA